MTKKGRLTFLPVFLTLLTVAFTVALAFRIRTYRTTEVAAQPATKSETPATGVGTPSGTRRADQPEGLVVASAPESEQ